LKDSTSVAACYNLANALYREENYTEAEKYSRAALDSLSRSPRAADAFYNNGDIYLQQRRWGEAIEAFKQSLRLNPGDMDAKSNLAYAQKMLENEQQDQQNQGQNQDQNQNNNDQNKDQNQNQDQDKNDDQNKDQNQDKNDDQNRDQQQNPNQDQQNDQNQPRQDNKDQKISPEAAEQMLQAIQAQEDETQEKVKKEKAAAIKSRQKEKNW
jgi:tetratricopeptide (TPR) repeat protein